MVYENLMVKPEKKITLKKFDTGYTDGYRSKKESEEDIPLYLQKLLDLQYLLYADKRYGCLIILQGVDASGKDGVFRNVITALNPQGTKVWGFEIPSSEELGLAYGC